MYHLNGLLSTLCWAILCLKSNSALSSCDSAQSPRVSLTSGCVEGLVKTTVLGRNYYSFQGIPYAAPPVGSLRFKAPRPVAPWTGVLKAFKESPACLQPWRENPFPISFSEDCLFLNVFTPYLKNSSGSPMPVMVWIHGGKFFQSSSSNYKYGPDFLLMKDVILVTFNYRLGIFGFLNLNTSDAQGNAGMKDMVAALRWVQREISKFGGDPSRVTVFGGSSGGSAVALLYISPLAKGLFHTAVSQSGVAVSQFAFLPSTASFGLRVASFLGCPTYNPHQAVSCLKNTNGSLLAEQQMIMKGAERVDLPFLPSIETYLGEEVFLSETPKKLIFKSGNIPYMVGLNNGEGLMYAELFNEFELRNNPEETIASFLPVDMVRNASQAALQKITSEINKFYFGQIKSMKEALYGFVDFMTDKQFSFYILKTVEALSPKIPVYLYYFTFQGAFQPVHSYSSLNLSGVCHGDELGYLFYRNHTVPAHNNISLYPRDMAMVKKAVDLWTNFAAFGNPTPVQQDELNVKWDPSIPSSNIHLTLGDTLEMVHNSLLKDRETLWENLYRLSLNQNGTCKKHKEQHYFVYTVASLIGIFSIILVVTYYIQYKRERSEYVEY